jgi:putative tryptophan/tyrosine transport system substrate-binding protein
MMHRCAFITGLGAGFVLRHTTAAQQPQKAYKIGSLSQATASVGDRYTDAFLQGLRDLGYVQGQNFVLERRYAEGRFDRLPDLAAELVALKVDVIFARSSHAVRAARNAAATIPIIALDLESDPVAMGFVATLAKPGGNITGIFLDLPEVSAKHVQFLTDLVPKLSRVAVLGDPTINASHFNAVLEAARVRGVRVQALEVRNEVDVDRALELAIRERAGALIVFSSGFMFLQGIKIAAAAAKNRLATIAMWREFVEAGGLMSYGADFLTVHRQCAVYVDKVLHGIKPGELPVERPATCQLVLNMKTAKALGLTIPPWLRLRADQVIDP